MSVMVQSGLAGVSIHTSFVSGCIAARTASSVRHVDEIDAIAEQRRLVLEPVAQTPVADLRRQHMAPGGSASTALVAAAMPEPNSSASCAPSSAAITRFGLAHGRVVRPAVA